MLYKPLAPLEQSILYGEPGLPVLCLHHSSASINVSAGRFSPFGAFSEFQVSNHHEILSVPKGHQDI